MDDPYGSYSQSWRDQYIAALLEPDSRMLEGQISAAEAAILKHAQELFEVPGDHIEEIEALDDALYALSALRNTYLLGTVCVETPIAAA